MGTEALSSVIRKIHRIPTVQRQFNTLISNMKYLTEELVKSVGMKHYILKHPFPVLISIQNMYAAFSGTRVRIICFSPRKTPKCVSRTASNLMICVDSKDPDLVHIGELGDHKHYHSECVEEEHGVLVVRGMWCYQVPVWTKKLGISVGILGPPSETCHDNPGSHLIHSPDCYQSFL